MSDEHKEFLIRIGGDMPPVLVDTHGRVIRSPETEAEIAALKARIAELEGRANTPSTAKDVVAKPPQFIDVDEHSYVAAHIDLDECVRCHGGVKTHPLISQDGSANYGEHCLACKCSWWNAFPVPPEPEMVRPRKTKAVDMSSDDPVWGGLTEGTR